MDVVIDLKGQTWTSTCQTFRIGASVDVTIVDSTGNGVVASKATASRNGGIVQYTGNGTLNIKGGTYKLTDDNVFAAGNTGALISFNASAKGTLNVSGGTFIGGNAKTGGILHANAATVNISGGEFFPGTATDGGDSLYLTGSAGVATISGGTIHGGVQVGSAKVTVEGTPVILKQENGSAYSLKGKLVVGELAEGAQIGITTTEDGEFTTKFATPNAAAAAAKFFVADEAGKEVKASGTELVVQTPVDIATVACNCEVCQGAVPAWTAWNGEDITAGGHYYVAEDIAVSDVIGMGNVDGENFTIVFNLNGKTVSSTVAKKVFQVKGGDTMIIVDSSAQGTGTVIGNPGTSHAGVIQVYGGNLVVEAGNFYLSSDKTTTIKGGIAYASSGGTITVHGGEFWGGNYAEGGVFSQSTGNMEITGGIIHAGTATNGDSVFYKGVEGNVVIGGTAVIEGGVQIDSAATVTISGKPVIEKVKNGSAYSLKLAQGVVLTVGTLEEDAKIAVTAADGAITTAFADAAAAEAAKAFFAADDEAKEIQIVDLALVLAAKAAQ